MGLGRAAHSSPPWTQTQVCLLLSAPLPTACQTKHLSMNPILCIFTPCPSPQALQGLHNHRAGNELGYKEQPGGITVPHLSPPPAVSLAPTERYFAERAQDVTEGTPQIWLPHCPRSPAWRHPYLHRQDGEQLALQDVTTVTSRPQREQCAAVPGRTWVRFAQVCPQSWQLCILSDKSF